MQHETSRYILDLTTVGIYWRSVLSQSAPASYDQVVSETDAFVLEHISIPQNLPTMARFMGNAGTPRQHKWFALKQFAVAVRYCFLAGVAVQSARLVQSNDQSFKGTVVLLNDGAASGIAVSPWYMDEQRAGRSIILQGGDISTWFDLSRWRQLRPINQRSDPALAYPLSQSSYWDPRYTSFLRSIGARELHHGLWRPPPASGNDDMRDFVVASSVARRDVS